jgi:DNA-binding SARP family transcriptional activator
VPAGIGVPAIDDAGRQGEMTRQVIDRQAGSSLTSAPGTPEGSIWTLQRLTTSPQLFEQFLYGLALLDRREGTLYLNRKARELLAPSDRRAPWTCCELICKHLGFLLAGGCMAERAAEAEGMLPELRMDIGDDQSRGSAWVTVSCLDAEASQLLFHLRPGRPGDRRRKTSVGNEDEGSTSGGKDIALRVSTLGSFRVEGTDGCVESDWLEQRPGQLLKYLICRRRQLVATDQIAEALWPEAGPDDARNRLRYYVHTLREKLEPDRPRRSPSRFIMARRGGYLLDTERIWVDADEFQREAHAGLAAFVQGSAEPAANHLDAAVRLYEGGFLSEDPYAEWIFDEREHLHELAGRVLRAQVRIRIQFGQLDLAADHARHLADLEPFDMDVQRTFLDICLRRGRRSEALRRYSTLRKRMLSSFGQEPDFDLPEVEASRN